MRFPAHKGWHSQSLCVWFFQYLKPKQEKNCQTSLYMFLMSCVLLWLFWCFVGQLSFSRYKFHQCHVSRPAGGYRSRMHKVLFVDDVHQDAPIEEVKEAGSPEKEIVSSDVCLFVWNV